MPGEPLESRRQRFEFADRLDNLRPDPQATFDTLQDGLGLPDLGTRLGLPLGAVYVPVADLSIGTLKTIEIVSQLVALFSRHGILSGRQQGEWLATYTGYRTGPRPSPLRGGLWVADTAEPPLTVLGAGAKKHGPRKDNIWRVAEVAAVDFLRPRFLQPAEREAWEVIDSGAGVRSAFASTLSLR